ncbi:MAG TPA: hypothetical protein VHG35_11210 [Gemmatimonadales bacterium]|nr:hypothetical protein [Gemmatimonadales bacterium]
MMTQVARSIAAAALLALVGCGGQGEQRPDQGTETGATAAPADTAVAKDLEVAAVMIGKRIGENDLITEPTFQFAPNDTIYISVSTEGAPDSATLSAKWRFQTGEVLDSSSKTIQPEGKDNTEFHITSEKGWREGTYNVIVYADGDSVDSKNFAVKK